MAKGDKRGGKGNDTAEPNTASRPVGNRFKPHEPDTWIMGEPHGSGNFYVAAVTVLGRVGIRDVGSGKYSIRVEPEDHIDGELIQLGEGWNTPTEDDPSWSRLVDSIDRDNSRARIVFKDALTAIGVREVLTYLNPIANLDSIPNWFESIIRDISTRHIRAKLGPEHDMGTVQLLLQDLRLQSRERAAAAERLAAERRRVSDEADQINQITRDIEEGVRQVRDALGRGIKVGCCGDDHVIIIEPPKQV